MIKDIQTLSDAFYGYHAAFHRGSRRRGQQGRALLLPTRSSTDATDNVEDVPTAGRAFVGSAGFVRVLREFGAALPDDAEDLLSDGHMMHGKKVPRKLLSSYRAIIAAAAAAVVASDSNGRGAQDEDLWRAYLLLDCYLRAPLDPF